MNNQKTADKIARDNGFDHAKYVGTVTEGMVYLGVNDDRRPTGLPFFIRLNPDGTVWSDFGFEYIHLVKEL